MRPRFVTHFWQRQRSTTTTRSTLKQSRHTTLPWSAPSKSAKRWTSPSNSSVSTSNSKTTTKSKKISTSATNYLRKEATGKERTSSKFTKASTASSSGISLQQANSSSTCYPPSTAQKWWATKSWSPTACWQEFSTWIESASRRRY